MVRFLLRRTGAGVVLVFFISTLTFGLVHVMGGDPARAILGQNASQDQVAAKAAELGLNRPVATQYTEWLRSAIRGDFGESWFTYQPVATTMSDRLPVTLSVVIVATVLSAMISVVLGTAAAVRRGWVDRAVQVLAVAGFALPGFWVALVLSLIFAVRLGWFPATGFVPLGTSAGGWLGSVILPSLALSVGLIASVAYQVRGSLIEVLRQDYIRTLRSRGLPEKVVLYRHALRNAAAPALAVMGLQFVGLLGGTVLVEKVFALPGIGSVAVSATTAGDIPLVMGLVVTMIVIVVVVNLLLDIVYGWLNPKVRVR